VVEVYKKILHYDLKQHIDPIQDKISIKIALAAMKNMLNNLLKCVKSLRIRDRMPLRGKKLKQIQICF